MASGVKDLMATNNSCNSRSGVVVSYNPEDTMKSFLFNQNNRHSLEFDRENLLSIFKLPQNEIEKALEYLSTDSESESSSMTKSTVKDASHLSDGSVNHAEKSNMHNINYENECMLSTTPENDEEDTTSADITNEYFRDGNNNLISEKTIYHENHQKSFEEILEEKLKDENMHKGVKAKPDSTRNIQPKTKFPFLRKNEGKAAWCGYIPKKNGSSAEVTAVKEAANKQRSKSTDRKEPAEPKHRHQKSLTTVPKKSLLPVSSSSISGNKAGTKNVHFAFSCDFTDHNGRMSVDHFPGKKPPHQPLEKAREQQTPSMGSDRDRELVEFELLEQIANVSISSTASSIARLDEQAIRDKLHGFKTMPPPDKYSLTSGYRDPCSPSNYCRTEGDHSGYSDDELEQPELSMCVEANEEIDSSHNEDTDMKFEHNEASEELTTTLSGYEDDCIPQAPIEVQSRRPPVPCLPRKVCPAQALVPMRQQFTRENGDDCSWLDSSPFLCLSQPDSGHVTNKHVLGAVPSAYRTGPSPWSFADPLHRSGSDTEDEVEDEEEERPVTQGGLGATLFPSLVVNKLNADSGDSTNSQSAKLKQWVQLLEKEIKRFKVENEEIAKLKKDREDGLKRLEDEMSSFEKYKEDEIKSFEEYKQLEIKKLKKERNVFEEYQEAMKNMPNKKDRQEIDRLKQEIETLREEAANKDSRLQAANSRMKLRMEQLESEKNEMRSRIHTLEQKRLHLQAQLVSVGQINPVINGTGLSKMSKPKPTVTSVSQAVSQKHVNIPLEGGSNGGNNKNNNNTATSRASKGGSRVPAAAASGKRSSGVPLSSRQTSRLPGTAALRGSAASDYYTGEEGSGAGSAASQDLGVSQEFHKPASTSHLNNPKSVCQIGKIDRTNDMVKDELRHPDGKMERIYVSGGSDVVYPNGSLKQICSDGKSFVLHLFNGDVKQVTTDGRVVYFYAQDENTHTTFPDGKEQVIFKNGHKEITYPSGVLEIHFPDDSVKIVRPDQSEENILPNGLIIKINSTGEKEILLPNGQREIHANGLKKRIYPDGTTKTVHPDGRQETCYASGRYRVKDRHGNLVVDQYIDKSQQQQPGSWREPQSAQPHQQLYS